MRKQISLIIILGWLLVACAPTAEPVAVTRPTTLTATAVPTLTNTPPATATIGPTPTSAPTNTPDPAAAQALFLETLQLELNGRQFRSVASKLDAHFFTGIYPAVYGDAGTQAILPYLETRLVPQEQPPAITFYPLSAEQIPPHLSAAALFPDSADQISIVGSAGWGLAGSGQALVYLRADGSSYRWRGLVLGYGAFEAKLALETMAAPAGLVYQIGNDYWQTDANGDPQLLIAHDGRLSLNPSATLALAAEAADDFVTMFNLSDGSSEVIDLDGRLMTSSNRVVWLDEETAVLLLTEERSLSQGTNGFPALLNTSSKTVTKLNLELSIYTQPTASHDGTITFGVNETSELQLWRDEQLATASIAALDTWPNHFSHPHLSPNGRLVIGTSTSEAEPGRIVYLLASMDQPDSKILHAIHAIPTDAAIPWHIVWSPDGQFVALSPPSWDFVEAGYWLVSVDGTSKIFLGPGPDAIIWGSGFSAPVWLDAERVVFSAVWDGKAGLQLYDLATNERFWLDTPQFAVTLHDGLRLAEGQMISPVQFATGLE